jgi:hypothetical protein
MKSGIIGIATYSETMSHPLIGGFPQVSRVRRHRTGDSIMIYVLHIGLAITAFLVVLNGFLRGAKKHQIDAVLGIVLLGILLTAFVTFGWKAGLLAMVLAFVYGALGRPVAARVAARLMSLGGGRSGTYLALPPRGLEGISRELGREVRPEDMMTELMASPNRHQQAENALLDYCLGQPAIQAVLEEFGANRDTLKNLYFTLCAAGAGQWAGGHWVAASALAYPHSLRFLLSNMQGGTSHMEQAYALIMHFERGAPLS